MINKKFTLIFMILTILISCGRVQSNEQDAPLEYTPIGEIWKDIQKYENEVITVCGRYRGWQGGGLKNPLITRSDWVVKDSTGAIYVTGKFPAGLGKNVTLGTEIVVKGQLLLSKDKAPYIKVKKIILK
ncbi:MAG: hypothetical protein LWW97_00510 [Deltaproteobacteria bacterium]|nr:hypothetical protein [Deltaproteobacteria bacterium]